MQDLKSSWEGPLLSDGTFAWHTDSPGFNASSQKDKVANDMEDPESAMATLGRQY